MRVYQLARKYKLPSNGLIELLRGIGIAVDHHMRSLDEHQAKKAEELLQRIKRGQEPLVFLCYSTKDLKFMHKLRDDLVKAKFTIWTAEGITPGTQSWTGAIEDAITRSRAVVVILSKNAKQSEWVGKEIHYALAKKKPIVPLLARDSDTDAILLPLAGVQWIDARGNKFRNAVKHLIGAIRRHIR